MKNTHTGLIRIQIRIRIQDAHTISEKYAAGTVSLFWKFQIIERIAEISEIFFALRFYKITVFFDYTCIFAYVKD